MASHPGARSRAAAGLPAITAGQIIDAAVSLTREHGVDGWSVRQLAGALEVWPAVVYHHLGERDAVVDAVTERVVALLPPPDADLPWRDWFTELLGAARPVLRAHRGVARRLALRGATMPSALRLIDSGVLVLARAGFGAEAPLAYSVLLNAACQLIAIEDDRDSRPQAGRRVAGVFDAQPDRPGLAAMSGAALADPDQLRTDDDLLYRYTIGCCLDGLDARLAALRA